MLVRHDYSGRFVLRLPSDLHRRLSTLALRARQSLNNLCLDLIHEGLKKSDDKKSWKQKYHPLLHQLRGHFGRQLVGFLIFGSQITGEATLSSDVDFLVVLDKSVPLTRSLYHWWDEKIKTADDSLSPQFVHIPSSAEEAGGIWFEIALSHEILWQKQKDVSNFLEKLNESVVKGRIRRYFQHGQPYWVWRDHEK